MPKHLCKKCDGGDITRRGFLQVGSLGLLGLGLGQYLQVSEALANSGVVVGKPKANACILLWLEGGPSQMDTWDPKPKNSGFKPIATNVDGIQISEILPRTAQNMDKLSLIRSMHTEESNHPQGTFYAMTGHRPVAAMKFPSFGSVICNETAPRNDLPQHILVPTPWESDFFDYRDAFGGGFLGKHDAMVMPDPSKEDFSVPDLVLPKSVTSEVIEHRRSFMNVVDQHFRRKEKLAEFGMMDDLNQKALSMLMSPEVKKAFDLSEEDEKTKDAYGRDRVGQSVLLARRLVERGCRFVTAAGYKHGQWDTHGDNDQRLRDELAPTLDRTLPTLLEDLDQRGLLETTVVIAMGEFGRTPKVNAGNGRDHYPECWSLAIGGGGISGGQVIGASDELGAHVTERMTSMGDVYATIYKAFGIDFTKTYMTPIGRPIYLANALGDVQGQPIPELV